MAAEPNSAVSADALQLDSGVAGDPTSSSASSSLNVTAPQISQEEYDRQLRELIASAGLSSSLALLGSTSGLVDSTLQSSLQAISDYNRAHDAKSVQDAPGSLQTTEDLLNEWGKRVAEQQLADQPQAKRTQLDNSASSLLQQQQSSVDDEFDDEDDGEDPYENGVSVDPTWSAPASMDPNSYLLWDANQNLRIASLPILDNLSTQILQTLGKGPYQETLNIVTQPESDQGQAYGALKTLFDQTKKLYTQEAFLNADELKLDSAEQRSTIRKVNLATFVSSVFGSQEVGFFHLNECFLDTFVPDGGRLLKSQGALYLDLKTQAYISAMSTNERPREDILSDLFPDDMEELLKARRPGTKQLTPSEADFVSRAQKRKQHLLNLPPETQLSEKYVWQDFLKDVSYYVCKNYESIVAQPQFKKARKIRHVHSQMARPLANYSAPESYTTMAQQEIQHHSPQNDFAATAAALSAHSANQYNPDAQQQIQNNLPQTQTTQSTPTPPTSTTTSHIPDPPNMFNSAAPATSGMAHSLGTPPVAQPPMIQSAPTAVLYERARLAATAKSSPNARRAGLPSQRRPWTTEEENALMTGLDRVKGPHWSQILAMFGPGGTVNEVLKDRNQVQLKDKARNLKLFFLKSGIEVPYYLQFVTGELKTRAPSQALKQQSPTPKPLPQPTMDGHDAAHIAAMNALHDHHRRLAADGGNNNYEDINNQSMLEQALNSLTQQHQPQQQQAQMPQVSQMQLPQLPQVQDNQLQPPQQQEQQQSATPLLDQAILEEAQRLIDSGALDNFNIVPSVEQQVKDALAGEGIGQSGQQLTA